MLNKIFVCVLAFTCHTISSLGQDDKKIDEFPFQVLYAEYCTNKEGRSIKNFDFLSINDAFKISAGGSITLIHYTGLPIEIKKDTFILIKALQEVIVPPTKEEKKKNNKREVVSNISRPKIQNLLALSWESVADKKTYEVICESAIDIQCPFEIDHKIFVDGDLNIKWEQTKTNNFNIELTTIFNEEIRSFSTQTNELRIDSLTIHKILKDNYDAIVLKVSGDREPPYLFLTVITKYPFSDFNFDFKCNTKSASMALLLGYYLEFYGIDSKEVSRYYYERATQLSDKEFFSTMLQNFNMRTPFWLQFATEALK